MSIELRYGFIFIDIAAFTWVGAFVASKVAPAPRISVTSFLIFLVLDVVGDR